MGLLVGILYLVITSGQARHSPESYRAKGHELLDQSRLVEAEKLFTEWVYAYPSDPDAYYELAITRVLLGKLQDARSGFLRVMVLDPHRADACFEMAATFVKDGSNAEALSWSRRCLQLAPDDEYGLDLLATAQYLAGAKAEALRYWNRLGRPHLTDITINVTGGVDRQEIAEEIDLSPGDLLSWREVEKAQWRLSQHRHLRRVGFEPVPGPTPDAYALQVAADGRRGIGSPWQFVFNTVADIGFRTWRFDYWNIGGSGATLSTKWRWFSAARLAQLEFTAPRPFHFALYPALTYTERDERWTFSPSEPGYHLHSRDVGMRLAVPVQLPAVSFTASIVGRQRKYELIPGADAGSIANGWPEGQHIDRRSPGAVWLGVSPRVVFGARPQSEHWEQRSRIRGEFAHGWTKGRDHIALSRFSFSAETRLEAPRLARQRVIAIGFHGGWLSDPGLVEDHFRLGAGPDTDFPLRAHPFLREGQPGSTPLARKFLLGTVSAASDLKRWNWFKIGVVAFADIAAVPDAYPGQDVPATLADTGLGVEFGSPLSSDGRFTLVWGRNWQGHGNVVYLASSFR